MKNMHTVVVGYDGSADGRRALHAAAEVVADGGTVHVVVAYRPLAATETEKLWRQLPEEFRRTFDVIATPRGYVSEAATILEGADASIEGHLIDGNAAAAILDTADEVGADLIVVGSRGLGRAARFTRGSVSARVSSHAKTSVLVVCSDDD